MEEMIGDTMDMMDDDDIEEAADAEVNNVLFQITDGMLGEAGSVGPALESKPIVTEDEEEEDEEEGPELDMMQKRLQVSGGFAVIRWRYSCVFVVGIEGIILLMFVLVSFTMITLINFEKIYYRRCRVMLSANGML